MLGRHWRWLDPAILRYLEWAAGRTRPRHRQVEQFLLKDPAFKRALRKLSGRLHIQHWVTGQPVMQPAPAAGAWAVPRIETLGALADWLWLEPSEVDWFADLKAWNGHSDRPQVKHYCYDVLRKTTGGVRLIESPKPRLKNIQRQILEWILCTIPVHDATHGFVGGRSTQTFAAPHVGQRVVLRMDLQNFFPALGRSRIQGLFRTAGYPESVADALGGICANTVPPEFWRNFRQEFQPIQLREARQLYGQPHLPQGAPTSPAVANLLCFRFDSRLAGLARTFGGRYTRYADDLAFSGDRNFEKQAKELPGYIAVIAREEGFQMNHRKTRFMRQSVRQHLAGLVVNQSVNVARPDFDRLKAILTNCMHYGPSNQNRDGHADFRAHLEGRISYVGSINPSKGQRLRTIAAQIRWP